jgi:serine/threonine-protein kinase
VSATSPPVAQLRQIDELCDRFEQAWQAGERPAMEDYLANANEADAEELFRALLGVELELRRAEQPLPDRTEYIRRFPDRRRVVIDAFGGCDAPAEPDIHFAEAPAQEPGEEIVMEVVSGPHQGQRFTFDKHDVFLVGRSAMAHLQLAGDPHFSRFHFRLEVNPPLCYLMDLGSRNGTFVNGEPVRECHLHSGDVISGGVTELKVVANSAAQTLELPPKVPIPVLPEALQVPFTGPALAQAAAAPLEAIEPSPIPQLPAPVKPVPPAAAKSSGSEIVPGYDILAEIGRGELGVVYRAIQRSLGRECALKVMTPAVSVADKTLQLFVRECSILGQLNHPHIVRLLDQGTAQGRLYLATEYVPTISLEDQLRGRKTADRVRLCCGLMLQALSALQYAHNRSLVHRDIKPGNILIARDGKTLSAKLADFGVAKQYANAGFSQITRSGDVIGSLPYMPPEQFLNSRDARPAYDLYAAGATLYHWLSGFTPHDFPAGRNQFLVILEDAPVPLADRVPDMPRPIAAVVDRALSRAPEQRYASATELRHAIKEAMSG